MAKTTSITVSRHEGGASFVYEFPCYVDSNGVFSAVTGEHAASVKAFAKDMKGVTIEIDRDYRQRLCSPDKKRLETVLNEFARDMLSGEKVTRLFVYYKAGVKGTFTQGSNGQMLPCDFNAVAQRVHLSGTEFGGRYDNARLAPDLSIVEVTKTTTKSGAVAYSTRQLRYEDAICHPDIGAAGVEITKWAPCFIGGDDWWKCKDHLIPYDEVTAAKISHMMSRMADLAFDMAKLRDEDRGELFE